MASLEPSELLGLKPGARDLGPIGHAEHLTNSFHVGIDDPQLDHVDAHNDADSSLLHSPPASGMPELALYEDEEHSELNYHSTDSLGSDALPSNGLASEDLVSEGLQHNDELGVEDSLNHARNLTSEHFCDTKPRLSAGCDIQSNISDSISLDAVDSNSANGFEDAERMLFEEGPGVADSADGTAKCEYCQSVGVQDDFYSKSKRFCRMECSKKYSALFQKKGPGTRVPVANGPGVNRKRKSLKPPIRLKKSKQDSPTDLDPAVVDEQPSTSSTLDVPDDSVGNGWLDQDFSWKEYLEASNDKAAPERFFKHCLKSPVLTEAHIGMKVEVPNSITEVQDDNISDSVSKDREGPYWIATVLSVDIHNLLLKYEGDEKDNNSSDFWFDARSKSLHPVGWCYSVQRPLIPPAGSKHMQSNWQDFLFKRLSGSRTFSSDFLERVHRGHYNKFEIGNKLEVADKHNLLSMCVATIVDIVGDRLRLRYDGLDAEVADDYWVHYLSNDIHPVGWSPLVGHTLSPPTGWRGSVKEFEDFLEIDIHESKDAPQEWFVPLSMGTPPSSGGCFEVGMKLEAIDPVNPLCITVASVMEVLKFNYMVVRLDSQSTYFICHSSSTSIFPAGWCKQHKIFLTPPKEFAGKPFDWNKYLAKTGAKVAPNKLFHNNVEAVDLREPSFMCPATIVEVYGPLLRVHFDGWDPTFDQWVDCESLDIFPAEWCSRNGHPLQPPGSLMPDPELESMRLRKSQLQSGGVQQRRNPSSHRTGNPVGRPPSAYRSYSTGSRSGGKAPTTGKASASGKGAKGGKGKHGKVKKSAVGASAATFEKQRFGNYREMRKGGEVQFSFNQKCACGPFLNADVIRKMPDSISGYLNGPPHQNCIRKSLHEIVNAAVDPNQLLELFSREFYQSKKHKDLKLDNVVCLEITGKNGKRFLRRVRGPSRSGILSKYLQRICEMLQCCPYLITEDRFPSGKCPADCHEVFISNATSVDPLSDAADEYHGLENLDDDTPIVDTNIATPDSAIGQDNDIKVEDEGNDEDCHLTNSLVTSSSHVLSPIDSPCDPSSSNTDRGIDPLNLLDQEFFSSRDPREWTVKEVADFMSAIGCPAHAQTFQKQEIDGKALFLLSFDELESLTENKLGPITKLKDALQSLKKMWQIQTPSS